MHKYPWQRTILYPFTPEPPISSFDAVHERLIWEEDTAEARRLVGTEGAAVSVVVEVGGGGGGNGVGVGEGAGGGGVGATYFCK